MALPKYKVKRNFTDNPQPSGESPDSDKILFVMHKHKSSRLHYDYRLEFEGIIPSGYGAGTAVVWDEGFYDLADLDGKVKKTQGKELREGIHSGKLHIELQGKKLKGKTLAQLEQTSTNFREAKRETPRKKIVSEEKRSRFPSKISPMPASRVDKPFDEEGWQIEITWDGYRAVAFCNNV